MPRRDPTTGKKGKRRAAREAARQSKRELDAIEAQIEEVGVELRRIKEAGASRKAQGDLIYRLLELKYSHPDLRHWTYQECIRDPAAAVEPKMFKIRWRCPDLRGTGTVRYQVPIHDRTSVTGTEVMEAINAYTARKRPDLGGFVHLDFLLPLEEGGKRRARQLVTADSAFRHALLNPGPRLANVTALDFEATFPDLSDQHLAPQAYTQLAAVPQIVDTGVNLFDESFVKDKNRVVVRAARAGVTNMIAISVDAASAEANLAVAAAYPGTVSLVVGYHPKSLPTPFDQATVDALETLILNHEDDVVGIGEIGLDYTAGRDGEEPDKANQAAWFEAQLVLAAKLRLPVLLHDRESHDDFMPILRRHRDSLSTCLVNCFTGTREHLDDYASCDAFLGITGCIASDSFAHLGETINAMASDRIVIGSDAPYLLPFNMPRPFPKKQRNEPGCLPFVLVKLAEILGCTIEETAELTNQNAVAMFPRLKLAVTNGTISPEARSGAAGVVGDVTAGEGTSDAAASTAEADALEAARSALPEGSELYEHDGKYYIASSKEVKILTRQRPALDDEAFDALVADFELEVAYDPAASSS